MNYHVVVQERKNPSELAFSQHFLRVAFRSMLSTLASLLLPNLQWMLLVKPFTLKRRAEAKTHMPVPVSHDEHDHDENLGDAAHAVASHTDDEDDEAHGGGDHGGHDGPVSVQCVLQMWK